jgi:hypothetical protein
MSHSLFLWDPFAILEGPREKDRFCRGLTKRGTPCKLYITEEVHTAGVKKLHSLACQPSDPLIPQYRLQDIVALRLCEMLRIMDKEGAFT